MSSLPRTENRMREFLAGARDQFPFLLGAIPFGLLFGAAAIDAGLPPPAVQGLSLFVFAGGSQFVAAGLIGQATPPLVIILTIAVVNLRHLLYSANLGPYYQSLSRRWKLILAWLLTDEAFATIVRRYQARETKQAHWYALGTGLILWAGWQSSTALGMILGAQILPTEVLSFVIPLSFLALLWPSLVDRPALAAAITAGILAVLAAGLPYRIGLIGASLGGIAAGALFEASRNRAGTVRHE